MQPKPILIRLLRDSGNCRTGSVKSFPFLDQVLNPPHFIRLFCLARHFVFSPLITGVRYVPLLVFPANNKASRMGGL